MASHGHHHSAYTSLGMQLEEMAMQQPMPMHYTQQAQQPDQMLMGGGGYGMPAPQLHAQMQPQLQEQMQVQQQLPVQMQPQLQAQMRPQFQAQMQPQLQAQIRPQFQAQMQPQFQEQMPVQQQLPVQMQPQLQAQMRPQFQAQMQPQLQAQIRPQFQAQMQPQFQEQMPVQQQLQAQMQPQLQAQMNQQQLFREQQMQEVPQDNDFKKHSLPLARIRKIMKSDSDVHMVASEASVFFSKACEMFVLDLTQRSWGHTQQNNQRTLQKSHVIDTAHNTDIFDFLEDIVLRGKPKERVGENDLDAYIDPSNSEGSMANPPMGEQVIP